MPALCLERNYSGALLLTISRACVKAASLRCAIMYFTPQRVLARSCVPQAVPNWKLNSI